MQKEVYLSKEESLDFETLFEIYENLKKQFFNTTPDDKLDFNVDFVFEAEKVDNSFDHEFGTERLYSIDLVQNSIQVYLVLKPQGQIRSEIKVQMKAQDMLSVSEFEEVVRLCNREIDKNVSSLLEV